MVRLLVARSVGVGRLAMVPDRVLGTLVVMMLTGLNMGGMAPPSEKNIVFLTL